MAFYACLSSPKKKVPVTCTISGNYLLRAKLSNGAPPPAENKYINWTINVNIKNGTASRSGGTGNVDSGSWTAGAAGVKYEAYAWVLEFNITGLSFTYEWVQ